MSQEVISKDLIISQTTKAQVKGKFGDPAEVDFDIKIEVEKVTNPVKYEYTGTYTGKIVDGQSTDPVKYNWKKNN